ncbi:MAG: hypothetical protein ACTSPB_01190 [Candidatus Thorarchaeota archaeon]
MVSKKDIRAIANLLNKYEEEFQELNAQEPRSARQISDIQMQVAGVNDVIDALDINYNDIYRAQRGDPI